MSKFLSVSLAFLSLLACASSSTRTGRDDQEGGNMMGTSDRRGGSDNAGGIRLGTSQTPMQGGATTSSGGSAQAGGATSNGSGGSPNAGGMGATNTGGVGGASNTDVARNGGTALGAGGARADMGSGTGGTPMTNTGTGQLIVYAQDGAKIQILSVDRASGEMTKKAAVDACRTPIHLQVDRAQKFLVGACNSDKGIVVLSINKTTGDLTKVGQAGGGTAVGVGINPAGTHALTSDYDGGATLFKIGNDGTPEKVQGVGAATNPHGARFDGTGKYAYVTNAGSNSIHQFAFDGSKLSPLSPATVTFVTSENAARKEPRYLVDSPDGKFIYVIGQRPPSVFTFKVGDNGELSKVGTGVSGLEGMPTGDINGKDIVLSPSGNVLYATIYANNTIAVFGLDKQTGTVTLKKVVDSGGKGPSQITVDPAGQFVFVTHQGSNDVVAFQVEKSTGLLSMGQKVKLGRGTEGVIAVNLQR